MKWNAFFHGRNVGAIGKSDWVKVIVEAENYEDARLALYKNYEHIHWLTLDPVIDN